MTAIAKIGRGGFISHSHTALSPGTARALCPCCSRDNPASRSNAGITPPTATRPGATSSAMIVSSATMRRSSLWICNRLQDDASSIAGSNDSHPWLIYIDAGSRRAGNEGRSSGRRRRGQGRKIIRGGDHQARRRDEGRRRVHVDEERGSHERDVVIR